MHSRDIKLAALHPVAISAMPNSTQFQTNRGRWEYDSVKSRAQLDEARLTYSDQLLALQLDGCPTGVLGSMSYIARNIVYGPRSHPLQTATNLTSVSFDGRPMTSLFPTAIYKLEMKIEEEKRV